MEALVDDNKLKDLIKRAIIEAIEEKKDMVRELLVEALEDVAMIHAIKDGEDTGLVERDEIFGILSGSEPVLHEDTVYQEFCQGSSRTQKE